MQTESELKLDLQALVQPDTAPCTESQALALLPAMLQHIGSTDAELRDALIYGSMATWLLERKFFSAEIKTHILTTVLDSNHLFHGIGEQNTDTVFTRSFSVLQLPLLIIAHRETAYLDRATLHDITDKVLAYLKDERDLRGFVPGKGWAHGIAHAADALEDLGQCEELGVAALQEMMDGVGGAISAESHAFVDDETDRAVAAVTTILARNLIPDAWLTNWLAQLVSKTTVNRWSPTDYTHANTIDFLRALYMHLNHRNQNLTLQEEILKTLKAQNPYVE